MATCSEETKKRIAEAMQREKWQHCMPVALKGKSLFGLTYFFIFWAHSLWWITFANYSNEAFHLSHTDWYLLNAVMYVPGTMVIALGLLASRMPNYLLIALSCAMMGAGLILSASTSSIIIFAVGVGVISFGLASFYAVMNATCLIGTRRFEAAKALGHLKSLRPLASITAAVALLVFFAPGFFVTLVTGLQSGDAQQVFENLFGFARGPALGESQVRNLLRIAGGVVLAAGFLAAASVRPKPEGIIYGRLRLRRPLWPYYALNFLAGARSGIFKASVIRLLVDDYQLQLHGTAVLVLTGQLCGFLGYRLIGRALQIFQPRNVLSTIYAVVGFVFFGLWLVSATGLFLRSQVLGILIVFFLLDSTVFGASVVTDSHLKNTNGGKNYLGDVATGMTLFSVAAFLVTLSGCLVWTHFRSAAFLVGVAVALAAIFTSRKLV